MLEQSRRGQLVVAFRPRWHQALDLELLTDLGISNALMNFWSWM